MSRGTSSKAGQWAFVIAFAVLGGISFWYWGAPSGEQVQRALEARQAREFEEQVTPDQGPVASEAMAYIQAVIDGDCDAIVSHTAWMQEREARLKAGGATELELKNDRMDLCGKFLDRMDDGYQAADEGVDDPYLFFPGVKYEFVGQDEGRQDLDVPVATRAWIALKFPSPTHCLKDQNGRAVSGITVGLNLTADGRVAKASVLGNAELQWDSVRYSW